MRDYNGVGQWSENEILARYARYASEVGIPQRDLSPREVTERGQHWVYPVMEKVIEGIKANDPACVRLGIEFIESDEKFMFGKTLKAKVARVLRRVSLSDSQKQRIRRRVFGMLRNGHIPHEYGDYAKLVRQIGFSLRDMGDVPATNAYVRKFRSYFKKAVEGQ